MAEGKEYLSCSDELGSIHISADVLAVAAAAAALEVPGVSSLAANLGSDLVEMLAGRKNLSKGVRVSARENSVLVDISLLVKYGSNIPDVAKAVQEAVATAIENTSSFSVEGVNIHVAGISFERPSKSN